MDLSNSSTAAALNFSTAPHLTHIVVVVTNPGNAADVGSVHNGEFADHSRIKKKFNSAIYRCPAHRRQLFTERLDCEAPLLLLHETGYSSSGKSDLNASVLQHSHQVWM